MLLQAKYRQFREQTSHGNHIPKHALDSLNHSKYFIYFHWFWINLKLRFVNVWSSGNIIKLSTKWNVKVHSLWHDFENIKQAASVSIWLILFFHIFFSFVDGHDANKYFQTVYNVIDHKLLCINEMKKPVGFDSFNIRLGKDKKRFTRRYWLIIVQVIDWNGRACLVTDLRHK